MAELTKSEFQPLLLKKYIRGSHRLISCRNPTYSIKVPAGSQSLAKAPLLSAHYTAGGCRRSADRGFRAHDRGRSTPIKLPKLSVTTWAKFMCSFCLVIR